MAILTVIHKLLVISIRLVSRFPPYERPSYNNYNDGHSPPHSKEATPTTVHKSAK